MQNIWQCEGGGGERCDGEESSEQRRGETWSCSEKLKTTLAALVKFSGILLHKYTLGFHYEETYNNQFFSQNTKIEQETIDISSLRTVKLFRHPNTHQKLFKKKKKRGGGEFVFPVWILFQNASSQSCFGVKKIEFEHFGPTIRHITIWAIFLSKYILQHNYAWIVVRYRFVVISPHPPTPNP